MQNEEAAHNQNKTKQPYPLLFEDYSDKQGSVGYWTEDGYFYEYDAMLDAASYYDPESDMYYEDYDDYEDDNEYTDAGYDDYWQKGKGKSKDKGKGSFGKGGKQPKGAQCTQCGSKFHKTEDCPMQRRNDDGGSASGKGYPAEQQAPEDNNNDDWNSGYDEEYWQQRPKGGGKGKSKKGRFHRWPRRAKGKGKKGNRHHPRFPRPPFASSSSSRSGNTPIHLVLAASHSMAQCRTASSPSTGYYESSTTSHYPAPSRLYGEPLPADEPTGFLPGGGMGFKPSSGGKGKGKGKTAPTPSAQDILFSPSAPVSNSESTPGTSSSAPTASPTISKPTPSSLCSRCDDVIHTCYICLRLICKNHMIKTPAAPVCLLCYKPTPEWMLDVSSHDDEDGHDHDPSDGSRRPEGQEHSEDDEYRQIFHSQRPAPSGAPAEAPPRSTACMDVVPFTHSTDMVLYKPAENYKDDKTGVTVSAVYPTVADFQIMHMIGGKEYYGLLLDPGASRGILGTDTLQCIITFVLDPFGKTKEMRWTTSMANFSGIAATIQRSIAMVTLPIGLMGLQGSVFRADVLGGDASQCPGLMPLRSLIGAGAISTFGCFSNGDGIIAFRDGKTQRMCPQRLYMTDSGHYLLPIDQFDKPIDERLVDFMIKHFTYRLSRNPATGHGQWPKGKGKGKNVGRSPNTADGNVFVVFDVGNQDHAAEMPDIPNTCIEELDSVFQ